ncbi:hypothetical protein MKX08_003721 [Trichoderma sp. CBMAI-0020]|nr:hypothetical protein MKX08_003721 [Trichoderma sp. CBMAI-0020]
MVSHRKKPKAGNRQNPNAARKTPPPPELQRPSKPPRLVCADCVYEDPVTCYPTIYKVKKKDVPQQANQPKAHGNNDTDTATDRAFGPDTTHEARELDDPGFRRHLDQLNAAHFLRSKLSHFGESSLSQNAPPLPTAGDAWASTNATIQPPGASASVSMGPLLSMAGDALEMMAPLVTDAQPPAAIPMINDAPLPTDADPLSTSQPPLPPPPPPPPLLPPPLPPPPPSIESSISPPINIGSQPESSLSHGYQGDSRPSSIDRGGEHTSDVPNYACHLIDNKTGYLKHDQKLAVVDMVRQLRSVLNNPKPVGKEAHKPIMPPYELSLYLLRVYHKEVCYLFPFICFSTFMRAYRRANGDKDAATGLSPSTSFGLGGSGETANTHSFMFRCALFTMLSHASKFSKLKEKDKIFLSRAFWECAYAHVTPALVKENSLAAVQTFLIVAISFNSTRFSGDERRIPIEIAYRLAQHMRLGDDGDGVMRSCGEKEVRMKTWYGCVMMTSFIQSGVNFHFPSASGVGTEALVPAHQPLSGRIPFSFFTSCVAHCEELEKILQNMPKMRSHVLSSESTSRHPHHLAELLEMLAKFQSVLPASLDWTTIGIPVLEVDTFKSADTLHMNSQTVEPHTGDSQASGSHAVRDAQMTNSDSATLQAAVCNTSFMLIRSMLFGPIFMEAGIQECLASGEDISALNTAGEQKARFCALQCLKNAVHLMNYMHRRSTPGTKVRELWWWDPYHVGTAGLVIIMAQTSQSLWASFDQALLQQAWKFCQELLVVDGFNGSFKRHVAEFLWKVNDGITNGRILTNEYFTVPEPPPATDKSQGGSKAWTFDVNPSRLAADGIIRLPYCVAQAPHGLPKKDYMDFEISPRTRIEDVVVQPAAMSVSNAFNSRPSLTPSADTDLTFTPSTELDFTFTPSMMEMDLTLDPNPYGNPAQPAASSNTPFSPSIWDVGSIYHKPASISSSSSFMPFIQQPPWTADMVACYDPTPASGPNMLFHQLPLTAGMAYHQPVPGPGASEPGAPPLRVMHFNPGLSTDHGQSAFSRDPTHLHAAYIPPAGAAPLNGGNIFLNGLKRKSRS